MREALKNLPSGPAAAAILGLCLVLGLAGCAPKAPLQGTPTPGLADAALTAGYPEMALSVADRILASDPRNVPALVARGDALYATGRTDDAAAAYRRGLAVQPADPAANAGLGRILLRTDPKAAEALFRTALRGRPEDPALLSNLAVTLDLQERHTEAQALYRRSLAVAPDVAATKTNLGLSLALSGDTAAAQALLRPLAAAPDASQQAHDNLAVAQILSGSPPTPAGLAAQTATATPSAPAGGAYVQLAAADSQTGAEAVWQRVRAQVGPLLAGHTQQIVAAEVNGRTFWRLRVPTASRAEARTLCDRLRGRAVHCWVTTG